MTKLFAALGPDGSMRFIGEVARGAACGCFCPECGSPLTAKQGLEKEWHFAHVSGQERPECDAGAANMFRRLAMEFLRKQQPLELPPCKTVVTERSSLGVLSEEVIWPVRLAGTVEWVVSASRASPVGRGSLEGGEILEILLGVGNPAMPGRPPTAAGEAAVLYLCRMPEVSALRTRVDAEKHLAAHGRFLWHRLPQRADLIDAAMARVRQRARAEDQEYERARRRQADTSRDGWPTADGGRVGAVASRALGKDLTAERTDRLQRSLDAPAEHFEWAPQRKSGAGFTLYRLRDGSSWVIYTLEDESHAIAAWPRAEDGWDEALPPRIATPDRALGVYRLHDLVEAIMFLRGKADIVRSTSNPHEFNNIA